MARKIEIGTILYSDELPEIDKNELVRMIYADVEELIRKSEDYLATHPIIPKPLKIF